MLHGVWAWLGYWTGISNEAGKGYGFWSGIGSCLTYIGVPLGFYRHANCHARWCWRLGRHAVSGTPYKVCRHHHPKLRSVAPTADQIRADHVIGRMR